MWETMTGSGAERVDNDGVRTQMAHAQMASLAQQIIDALPDRIKQETFVEEEYDGAEQQQQPQHYQDCFQNVPYVEAVGTSQPQPAAASASTGFPCYPSPKQSCVNADFLSYRYD